jgi:hypothetical protein
MRMMLKVIMAGALVPLITATVARAANAGVCPAVTLAFYLATGFTCTDTSGDITFSAFTYTPITSGTGTASSAFGVGVTLLNPGPGFTFSGAWDSGVGPGTAEAAQATRWR